MDLDYILKEVEFVGRTFYNYPLVVEYLNENINEEFTILRSEKDVLNDLFGYHAEEFIKKEGINPIEKGDIVKIKHIQTEKDVSGVISGCFGSIPDLSIIVEDVNGIKDDFHIPMGTFYQKKQENPFYNDLSFRRG